jgi:hypothetical protein
MATQKEHKLKKLLDQHKPGTVSLAAWLEGLGISRDLQKYYRRSGWLESVGKGAYQRRGDSVGWQGGLNALQTQAKLPIHAGAMTALAMQGFAHYVRLANSKVYLFSAPKTPLPAWFRNRYWGSPIQHVRSSILPIAIGLTEFEAKSFAIRISAPERAMLECLHLAPEELDLVECFQVMEGLSNLRPKLVQELLEKCTSIKAKRLFLYMAEKANHQWLSFVATSKIDLGTGERSLARGGDYVSKYHLVLPHALVSS